MANLAIIPARGGSKRIPRKNIKSFLGKPILAYSIEATLKSGLFDEVMVSTDDDEIANTAKEYGANVPFIRSNKNANDYATLAEVILEVLESYRKKGKMFNYVLCVLPTAPFVSAKKVTDSFTVLKTNNFDTVFPVIEFSYPIQRALKFNNKNIEMVAPQYLNSRSQDLENRFHDSGQFYWLDVEKFKASKKLFSENSGAIIISELESQDIDTETDWKLAEIKYKLMLENGEGSL